ncbi:asparaginase, partial [Streptomyces nigra]
VVSRTPADTPPSRSAPLPQRTGHLPVRRFAARLLAKDGFEGVQVAALPDGRAVAVKIADGANRARVPVAAAALAWAGVDPASLTEFGGEALLGGGHEVGRVRPVPALEPAPVSALSA